jgi:hypothetical protein
MARLRRSKLVANADQLRLLGEIAIFTGYLENYIEQLIELLLDTDLLTARCVTKQFNSTGQKLGLLEVLAKRRLKMPSHKALFTVKIFPELNNILTDRNTVIHGIWAYEDGDKKKPIVIGYKGEYKHKGKKDDTWNTKKLTALADRAHKMYELLGLAESSLREAIKANPHAILLGKVGEQPRRASPRPNQSDSH